MSEAVPQPILIGRHVLTGEPIRVAVREGSIAAVDPVSPDYETEHWPFIAPGLLDLQINGHGGVWFGQKGMTVEQVLTALEAYFHHGVTRLCPTLITNSVEHLEEGFTTIRLACEREPWADRMVVGCHLEGPYISSEDGPRGAHTKAYLRPADWTEFERYQRASGNRIRLVTLAPEVPGALEFIERATAEGVRIAIGHTAADSSTIREAVQRGAGLSTHLGNGAHPVLRRHPNYLWDQLAEPDLMTSLITDGYHLPENFIRTVLAAKGEANCIVTCDAAGLAGCPPGRYMAEQVEVEVLDDGRIVIAGQNQLLAGSAVATDRCLEVLREMLGWGWDRLWPLASINPARFLGVQPQTLEVGQAADLVQFTEDASRMLRFGCVMASGTVRSGTPITE